MESLAIQTTNLTKTFNKQTVVNKVNMEVKKGDIYGLIGKNGAGKTTIMKMLCGLMKPKEGEIKILEETSKGCFNKSSSRIGNILETPSFFPYMSARENLEYYRIQKGISEKEIVDELLQKVRLTATGKKPFKQFSLGMKQRLGLAYALLGHPDILILDEPINGLDPEGIVHFREIITKLNRDEKVTVLISSHILGELSQLATTYGFIKDGELIEEISAREVIDKCKHHLLVKVDDVKGATVVLEKELGIISYEVIDSKHIKIFDYLEKPEQIVKALVLEGILVSTIQEIEGNLEEYYLRVMGENVYA